MGFANRLTAALSAAAFTAAMAAAQPGDTGEKAISSPSSFWTVWGSPVKINWVSAPAVKGSAAQRVTVSPRPPNPWDVGTVITSNKPVQRGDVIVLTFTARAERTPGGSDLMMLTGRIYEAGEGGGNVSQDATFLLGKQWKRYYITATVTKNYPAGGLSGGMFLGTADQTVDFGQVVLLDYGPGFDPNSLPQN